jgi:hypothetical protein
MDDSPKDPKIAGLHLGSESTPRILRRGSMRKMRLTVLTGVVVVFLLSFVTPTQAGLPETASGQFLYFGTGATPRFAGCNLFFDITEIAE